MNKRVSGEGRALCNLSTGSRWEDRVCLGEKVLIPLIQKLANWGIPTAFHRNSHQLTQVVWDHPLYPCLWVRGAPVAKTTSSAPECPEVHSKFDLFCLSCGASARTVTSVGGSWEHAPSHRDRLSLSASLCPWVNQVKK